MGLFEVFFYGYSSFYSALMYYIAGKIGKAKWKIDGVAGAHRSWLTHSPIGTLIRIFFINAPIAYLYQLIVVGLSFADIHIEISELDFLVFFIAQTVGLGISDGIHVYLDNNK